jgi:hypothetical protein
MTKTNWYERRAQFLKNFVSSMMLLQESTGMEEEPSFYTNMLAV